jgi:hypothetical protein
MTRGIVGANVFINYRGDDSRSYAALLHRELRQHFGDDSVFLDSESIPAGGDFEIHLLDRLRECRVLLAVIGPRWLTLSDRSGRRRVDDSGDWIRRELVEAFRAGLRVIPIIVDDGLLPGAEDLPPDIQPLSRCQYRRLRHKDASADLSRIVADLAVTMGAGVPSSVPANRDMQRWRRYPVGIDHESLLGADRTIAAITDLVSSETTGWALTVSGDGGRGKTALTYEAVSQLAASGRFTRVVWASAKNTVFRTDNAASGGTVDWLDVARLVAEQLDCELGPNRRLWERDLRERVRELDDHERILLVVDNLEGVHDAEQVIERVARLGFGRPHKLVATTRWALHGNDYANPDIPVSLLSRQDTMDLARTIGRDDAELATVPDETLTPVYDITEGNPFLVKLIVRRYLRTGRALDDVIGELTTVDHAGRSEALGSYVRRYLYEQSLDELADRFDHISAERLMASFCFAARGEALTEAELRDWCSVEGPVFTELLETACSLALIRPSRRNRRYSIHSLLYEFTCAAP